MKDWSISSVASAKTSRVGISLGEKHSLAHFCLSSPLCFFEFVPHPPTGAERICQAVQKPSQNDILPFMVVVRLFFQFLWELSIS